MKKLSIVVPVYYNEANLPETIPRLLDIKKSLADLNLELVFVDDGSGDGSFALLSDWRARHPDVIKVVKLTRNFGSMAAIQAGFLHATGDCVAVISADLQDPLDLIPRMVERWTSGARAIFAVRATRKDEPVDRWAARLYYALIRRFAVPNYPKGGFDFVLIDRHLVNLINGMREKNTHLMALVFWLGFEPVLIPYTRVRRTAGVSRWTLMKKIKLFLDSFVAFSYVPIRFLSATGIVVSTLAFAYALLILYMRIAHGVVVHGWTALAVAVVMLGGIQMLMLGVIGEYVWRTLDETRRRPTFVVDRVLDGPS